MLKGECIFLVFYDGSVKMWDICSDLCVVIVGKSLSFILCMDYDDSIEILVVVGVDGYVFCVF